MKNIITEKLSILYEQIGKKVYKVSFSQKFMAGWLEFEHESTTNDGTPVFDFLMTDLDFIYNSEGKLVEGAKPILYFCLGDHAGEIEYRNFVTKKKVEVHWGLFNNKSNPDKVKKVIDTMYKDKIFTPDQYKKLIEQINFSRKMEDMYDIVNHLKPKK